MKYAIVIPARYNSTRFPGKPLIDIKGKTMIQRVYEKCLLSVNSELIYVATDDERIELHCKENDIKCIITSESCLTGTDRIGEVAQKIDADYFINVQGDEPVFNPKDIDLLIDELIKNKNLYDVYCGYCPINSPEMFFSSDVPKAALNSKSELIYMSRSPIPGNKKGEFKFGYRQVCAYAFSRESLKLFCLQKRKTPLEEQEDIELLRFLELGVKIKMLEMSDESIPIDREEDLKKVLEYLK